MRAWALAALAVVGATVGCGVAPVRSTPGPPPSWAYVDPHGRPRAFGSGVCPLQGRHTHGWPPSPAAAFVDDDGAWRDTRPIVTFTGPHPLGARRCATPGLHQHALPVDVSAGSAAARP